MLIKSKWGVLRLFKGWIDHAARKNEHVTKEATVHRVDAKGKSQSRFSIEKTSETIAALLKRPDAATLTVWSVEKQKLLPIPEYLALRAERKAKKLAKISAQAAQLAAEAVVVKDAGEKPNAAGAKMFWVKTDAGYTVLSHLVLASSPEEALLKFKKKHPDETVMSIEPQSNPFEKPAAQA